MPGFLTLQRWIGAENPKQSVETYDLDNLAVLQSPGYRANGRPAAAADPANVAPKESGGTTMAKTRGTGLLMVRSDIDAEFEAKFNRWYDEEHVPRLL